MTIFDILVICGGGVLVLLAVFSAFAAFRGEDRVRAIQDTQSYTALEIQQIYRHAGGGFGQPCEITGVAECDWSMAGPLSGQPCIAYSHTITWEEWKQTVHYERNALGGQKLDTDDHYVGGGTDVDDRHVPTFWVRDATGRILIDPQNAELDLLEIDERYEDVSSSFGGTRRATRKEKALPVGHQVYVLGYLGERQGEPTLTRHPSNPQNKFLISYRSEQDFARANSRNASLYYFLAGSSGTIGLLLVLWRLLIHRV
jgi:hypothetical protein